MNKTGAIRVAIVGDSHFDETSRFEECVRVHDFIADQVVNLGIDVLLHSGDVFERKSTPAERSAVAHWLTRVADRCPVVIVRGNHDALHDLMIFQKLRTNHHIRVIQGADVHIVGTKGGCVAVGGLAWPRKAELLAASGAVGQEAEALAQDALRNVLRGIGAQFARHPRVPRILLAHAMVTGSVTSTGQPLVGHDMELGLADLVLAKADLYALGHVHKGQAWEIDGAPVVYPGSPRRTAFGELEPKGFRVIDLDTAAGQGCTDDDEGRSWGVIENELVETPCAPMILAEDEWGLNGDGRAGWLVGWHGLDPDRAGGAEIRLRYKVSSEDRDAARAAAAKTREDLITRGAVSVKVEEEVIATARARIPEIARATTIAEKLQALWDARGVELGEQRKPRVIDRLHQVEQEERAA